MIINGAVITSDKTFLVGCTIACGGKKKKCCMKFQKKGKQQCKKCPTIIT